MAKITGGIAKKIEKIARKLTGDDEEFYDAFQIGTQKVCEMIDGHTESYYVQYAYKKIQDYLRKERKFHKRHPQIVSDRIIENATEEPLEFGIKTSIPDYDNLDRE